MDYWKFYPLLNGKTVEFGAGIGNISTLIWPNVSKLDLVEPSSNLVGPLRSRFENDEAVAVFNEPLESYLPAVSDKTFDTVILVNVLEHIENDIEALNEFYRILAPGGHLLLFVPALKFLYSNLDSLVGHYRRYQRDELNNRTTNAGFEILQSKYFDTLGVAPWLIINKMLGATGFNPFLVNLYDIIFAPLSRGIEKL